MQPRKIIHIDMDAFYASVELREQPHLKGRPVVVAWEGPRSVICAASYEARQYGLRSAMPVATAKRLCPHAIYIPPQFSLYREVSQHIHHIFARYTPLIEPLSLDEAYLDVTQNLKNITYASDIATSIRADIFRETGLTASAGIAPNKFLAKIASDWRKPNNQFVLPPQKIDRFLATLPLEKIPGVGKVTLAKLHQLGLYTAGDLKTQPRSILLNHFGRYGYRLYDLARGIDERPVKPERERLQISNEITLPDDYPIASIITHLPDLATDLWQQMAKKNVQARTITLKLKTTDFKIFTRSTTYSSSFPNAAALLTAAQALTSKMPQQPYYRLIGIGVSHLLPAGGQQSLWDDYSLVPQEIK